MGATAAPLIIATSAGQSQLVQALEDGRVSVPGFDCRIVKLTPGDDVLMTHVFENPSFDVIEMSLSKYVSLTQDGGCPFLGLPVFIARSFRHGDFYIRTGRGIRTPQDLRGLRVGTGDYRHTAHVWARAMLCDEYGVAPQEIDWIVGHREKPYVAPADPFSPPAGVRLSVAPADRSLSEMLRRGEIDALLSPLPPSCWTDGAPGIGKLFEDPVQAGVDFHRRTGHFPIIHLIGVRKDVINRFPQLASDLFAAFTQSKDLWLSALSEKDPASPHLRAAQAMGPDYYAYGTAGPEIRTLNYFLDQHVRQGLSRKRPDLRDLLGLPA